MLNVGVYWKEKGTESSGSDGDGRKYILLDGLRQGNPQIKEDKESRAG